MTNWESYFITTTVGPVRQMLNSLVLNWVREHDRLLCLVDTSLFSVSQVHDECFCQRNKPSDCVWLLFWLNCWSTQHEKKRFILKLWLEARACLPGNDIPAIFIFSLKTWDYNRNSIAVYGKYKWIIAYAVTWTYSLYLYHIPSVHQFLDSTLLN